ncbi:PQQ-binding-like beta-propeller repeat protein [Paracoccus sp. (in: a-proteobacteria)]|uniref:outer membrane protein assembly factor BamB family protein n=1 Tax=Paracoccus sp. TaxID=267 RepID=UPI0028A9C7C0|nr:PQQ-binding-like beta-propeller repeat protein [Paracoccus sp. (in: a-proteobacteria)]
MAVFSLFSPQVLAAATLLLPTCLAPITAWAESDFDTPAAFAGKVSFSGPQRGAIFAGGPVEITGDGFLPGQQIALRRGNTLLSDGLKADDKGVFSLGLTLPQDAAVGLHPVVIQTEKPDSAAVAELKVSPMVPLAGAESFDITQAKLADGVYQVAHSARNGTIFVAAASGRPPEGTSSIIKLDATTLEVLAEVTPAADPVNGGVFGVFGVAVDDTNGTVWVSNTRQNTIAVYAQDNLSLIRQFEEGAVEKPRDLVIDVQRGRTYVSTHRNRIEEFDLKTMEKLAGFTLASQQRGEQFMTMSLALDENAGQLYTVSLRTPEFARIDLASGQATILPVPGAVTPSGVDVDPATGRVFVASQGSDDLIALDGASGKVLFDTPVGAGTLNVRFDPTGNRLFVANRVSDTITVLDATSGKVTANLDGGSFPNHLTVTPDGTVFAVNKARGKDDDKGNLLRRIAPKG